MQPFDPPPPLDAGMNDGVDAGPPPPTPPPPQERDWERLHIASPILNSLATAIQFWPVLLIAVINEGGGPVLGIIIGVGLLAALGVAILRYLRFDYRLEGTTLVVRSGVLVRTVRTVPADRVQQVSRNEKLRHRLFAVAEVSVEVAGAGNEPDVKLSVVSTAEAERIRVRLQDARRELGAAPPAPDHVVYEAPNQFLLRWAAVASPLFILPVVGAAVGTLGEAVDLEKAWGWLPDGGELWFLAATGVIGLAAATAINLARFYDMRLVRADNDLRLDYGLLTRRKLELPSERIQALVLKLSVPGRLSGTVGVTVHNASSAGEGTHSYFPAIPRADRAQLVERLVPGIDVAASLAGHPRAALRRSVIRWTWPVALGATAVWAAFRAAPAAWLLFLVIPAAALGWRAWQVLGHGETSDVVVARRGAVTESTSVVRRARVQSVSVVANWFQRRLGLATLRIHVAQPLGKVSIRDMGQDDAATMAVRLAQHIPTVNGSDRTAGHLDGGNNEPGEQSEE